MDDAEADVKRQAACEQLELATSSADAVTASLAAGGLPPPVGLEHQSYEWVLARYQEASAECMCGPLIRKRDEAANELDDCQTELDDLEAERTDTAIELAAKYVELAECGGHKKAAEVLLCSSSKSAEIAVLIRKLSRLDRQIVKAKRKVAQASDKFTKALMAEEQCTANRRIRLSLKYDVSEANGSTRAVGNIDFERGVLTGATSLLTVDGIADQMSTTVMIAKGSGMYICAAPPTTTGPTLPSDNTNSLAHDGGTVSHKKTWSGWDQTFLAVAEVRVKDIKTRRLRLSVLPFKDTKLSYTGDGCIPAGSIDPLLAAVFHQTVSAVPGSLPYTVDCRLPGVDEGAVELRTVETFKAPYSGTATWIVHIE